MPATSQDCSPSSRSTSGSILSATDYAFLSKRFTGLVQLTYSLVIGYAMFLTLVHGERRRIANILLGFCVFIIVGCLLEAYAGLRPISDAVRERLYDTSIIYDADLRDQLLYGRVRPKLFTSEPSAVTFAYTQYSTLWLVVESVAAEAAGISWHGRARAVRAARAHSGLDAAAGGPLSDLPRRRTTGTPAVDNPHGRLPRPLGPSRRLDDRAWSDLLRRKVE